MDVVEVVRTDIEVGKNLSRNAMATSFLLLFAHPSMKLRQYIWKQAPRTFNPAHSNFEGRAGTPEGPASVLGSWLSAGQLFTCGGSHAMVPRLSPRTVPFEVDSIFLFMRVATLFLHTMTSLDSPLLI